MEMENNPYRSPESIEDVAPKNLPRADALLRFRIAIALLIIAALVNGFFLPRYRYTGAAVVFTTYRIGLLDFIFIAAIGFFAMTCTFEVLERLAKLLRRILSPNSDPDSWNNAIYNAFRPAIPLGLLGALLWIIWVIAFFELEVNFYLISYAIGIPAHLLAAAIYLRILWGWFKAARSTVSCNAAKSETVNL
jgi:hypothetical protein